MIWENPKDKDVTDIYGAIIPDKWLAGESITSSVFTSEIDSELTLVDNVPVGSIVSAVVSGGVTGFHKVHIRTVTPTRQREDCVTLWIKDCM